MKAWLKRALKVALLLYPLYVWWAINHWHPAAALLPIAGIALFKSFTGQGGLASRSFFLVTCLSLILAMLLGQAEHAMLYYPVWMNAGMLLLFGYSLLYPPTVVERIARLMDGELDQKAQTYTRKVTQVWCLFFLINGSIALLTATLGDWDLWLLYNGFIAYVLMGLLMFIEWQVRRVVKAAK
ncbi:hypothetical protein BI198_01705 [Rheinheimera salexigens]|uniref:DNA gyrase subunit B n=1 Tax=Rheinheimera salexigens TaxID=1628148 RepID=A0A1E7Q9S6_9GAMM|nr:hypothetical protein BI198_01705 [Rheinheimera salexigens]